MTYTYEWTNVYDARVGYSTYTPPWWTSSSALVSTAVSPLGPGSTLVKCAVGIDIGIYCYTVGAFSNPAEGWMHDMVFGGEVYEVGSTTFPFIKGHTNETLAIAGECQTYTQQVGGKVDGTFGTRYQTGGLVWSEAKRGPDKYGSGTPELKVAVAFSNTGVITDEMGGFTISERFWVRALWRI